MQALSRTLVVGTTLLTGVVFVTAGVVLFVLTRMSLVAELDRSLVDRAGLLASTIEIEDGELDLELVDLDMQTFEGRRPAAYVQVWSADGATLYKSRSLAKTDLTHRPAPQHLPEHFNVKLPDGRRGRAVCLAFLPRMESVVAEERGLRKSESTPALSGGADGEPVSLALAQSTSHIDTTLARLRRLLFLVGGAAVVVASSSLWYYVVRSLRPLNQLAQEIGQVGENDLSKAIGGTEYPSEINPVVERLNQLLQRLDAAFQRERTMNANVAHELRNPLTGLRLKLDVALSRDREPHQYRQTIEACRAITSQLQQMVDTLLSLARLDAGQVNLHTESVRLDALIQTQWDTLAAEAEQRGLRVQWAVDSAVTIATDAALLAVAVRNLLDNAVTYAEQGGIVRVGTEVLDSGVEILVTNSGSRLTQAEAENALVPFWQHDPSRSTTGVHCGLGLSLVQRIVAVLQGQLSVKSSPAGEFEIAVVLPLLAAAESETRDLLSADLIGGE